MSTPTSSPTSPRRRRLTAAGLWSLAGLAVIVVGFAGVDQWFYQNVSLALNDESRPAGRDFHAITKPLWELIRLAFASIYAAALLAILGAIIDDRRWRQFALAFAVVAVVALLANVLQGAIGRERPNQGHNHLSFKPPFSELLTKRGVCFPSGEATMAFAIAAAGSTLAPRFGRMFFFGASLAALARLVNGAHYPSDVAAGALLGYWLTRTLLLRWVVTTPPR